MKPPSSGDPDTELKVSYTIDDLVYTDSIDLTICRCSGTTSSAGTCFTNDNGKYHNRYYYHQVKDQFDITLNQTGIYCDENISTVYGGCGSEQSGYTGNWDSDGGWTGGVAVRDHLGCPYTHEDTKCDQELEAGYWNTSPDYYIYMEPLTEWPSLWKTSH